MAGDASFVGTDPVVLLVGTKKAMGMTVRRQDTSQRHTALRRRLEGKDG